MYSFLGETKINCDEVLYIKKTMYEDYIVKFKDGTEIKIPGYRISKEQLEKFGTE